MAFLNIKSTVTTQKRETERVSVKLSSACPAGLNTLFSKYRQGEFKQQTCFLKILEVRNLQSEC